MFSNKESGSNALPQAVFGISERISTFSAVVFNAVPDGYLFAGKLEEIE